VVAQQRLNVTLHYCTLPVLLKLANEKRFKIFWVYLIIFIFHILSSVMTERNKKIACADKAAYICFY